MKAASQTFVVGVDGCKSGWFCVRINSDHSWETNCFDDIAVLGREWGDARLILIDVPIGLPDRHKPVRPCDQEARRLLKWPRASSVFSPPSRVAFNGKSHPQASRLNKAEVGRGLSLQAYGILKRIREVNGFLTREKSARGVIREVHPEMCFWAFNGHRAMKYRKKSKAGFKERLRLLSRVFLPAHDIVAPVAMQFTRNRKPAHQLSTRFRRQLSDRDSP